MEPPPECDFTVDLIGNASFQKIQTLYDGQIIAKPSFQNCLPVCGICQHSKTDSYYTIYNFVVIGIILPLIGLFGLWGNIVSAFVYSRKRVIKALTPGSLYLSALGCSDTAVILTALFIFFLDLIRKYSLTLSIVVGTMSPIIYPLALIAQTCSVYFTLVAGIDCFMQICWPICAKQVFNSRCFVKAAIFVVVMFSIGYNFPHFFESFSLDCWHKGFDAASVEYCPTELRFNELYILIYYQYMYAVFLAVGPLLVLVILNSIILFFVFTKKCTSDINDNIALILVVVLFILCNTIALLINMFEEYLSVALSWRINYIIDISNLLVVINSSLNFGIYYRFSRPFRLEFLHHFLGQKARQDLLLHTNMIVSVSTRDLRFLNAPNVQDNRFFQSGQSTTRSSNECLCRYQQQNGKGPPQRNDSGIEVEPSCGNGNACSSSSDVIFMDIRPNRQDPSLLSISVI